MKEALLNRAKVAGALSAKGRATKVSKVGRGLPYEGVPNEDCYPELNALPQREPIEDIPHIGRNVVKFRYPINLAGSRAQNAIQAVQASGRETNKKRTTVVKPEGDKRTDKGGCGSTGKWAGNCAELAELVVTFTAKRVDVGSKGEFLI